MKKIYYLILLLSTTVFSQTITVDNSSNSAQDLVNLLVNNTCVETSNWAYSSNQSVAYFNQNGSAFPITEGVIIRSGNAINSQGTYTGANMGSISTGGGTDAFLQNLSNTSSGTTGTLVDFSFLEFDFNSISNSFNFNFLFASNEYGEFQCLSNDILAFELTDLVTLTTTNIAVIPNTTNPVSTRTIKDASYNNTCSSSNAVLFDTYNVDNPGASTLNMRGHTVVMSAGANIIPLRPYRLKLVIADYISTNYDSAIFISASSFITTLDLGPDQTICSGDSFTLDTLLDNTFTFQWFLGGLPIAGATNPTYDVTQPGTYSVEVNKGTCFITDEIIFNNLIVNSPNDLSTCDSGGATNPYNLTLNDEVALGVDNTIFDVFYYTSLADASSNNFIPIANLNPFPGTNGQTIYIKILNTVTGNFCDAVYDFDLLVTPNITAGTNITAAVCEDAGTYDLSLNDIDVINGQTGTYTITYYNTEADAQSGTNTIGSNAPIPVGPASITYWIRIEDSTNGSCFDVTSIEITINPLPPVDTIAEIIECSNYMLLPLINGTYYTLSGGPTTPGQVQLNAGEIIDLSGTYYVFAGPDANGCTNESSFTAYFVDEYVPQLDNCGQFIVPTPPYDIGAFYTDFGGPTGAGTLIPIGTEFTNNTLTTMVVTIFYYAEVPIGTPCRDERYDINIHPNPLIDTPLDLTACNSTSLPPLTNGNYFLLSGGPLATGQVQLNTGDTIDLTGPYFSGTYYVYNELPYMDINNMPQVCFLENPFQVNIIDPSIFGNIFACESYTLPPLTFGGYFDAPNGGGNSINPADPIQTSQIVYYYANVTDASNCTEFLNYNITIYTQVPVDINAGGSFCGEYILPELNPNSGNYYALPGGPSNSSQLPIPAGSIIDLTGGLPQGTYYIYNEITHANSDGTTTLCSNESSFNIVVEPFPGLDQAINTIECDPYFMSVPSIGDYYTAAGGPGGSGTIVDPSVEYTSTQTFFLYYSDPASGCIIDKEFQRIFKGVNLPSIADIVSCDSAMLDATLLNHLPPEGAESLYQIEYHFDDPSGAIIDPNTYIFNTTNTPTPQTICLYAVNDDNFLTYCPEERYFTVSILETPVLPSYTALDNRNYCGTYTLPALPAISVVTTGTYTVNYYSQPGGNAADIINPANYTFTNSGNTPTTHDVWVYAQTTIDNVFKCTDEEHFQFTVYPLLDLVIEGGIICVNAETGITEQSLLLDSGLNPADFTVNWYLGGLLVWTGQTYLASEEGTYTVVMTKVLADNPPDCNYKTTTVVVLKSSSAIASVEVTIPFENNAVITVNLDSGFGNYIFQLDDGEFQTNNQFFNVSTGEHRITVRDIYNYCGDFVLYASVVKYPNFFTPNGDGHNDTWNIVDLATDYPESIISIFDRYGKLIKQISPTGKGWDGQFNGKDLPSTDYWFLVNFKYKGQEKEFRAHFTLKR